jgi:hypothetical protein
MPKGDKYKSFEPMRIQARKGSAAEKRYYQSALPGGAWPMPKAIAAGVNPAPLDDLIFHGGKTVPQMEFQNIYLGGTDSWRADDIDFIDRSIRMAMRDRRLNIVMAQYFPGSALACEARDSFILDEDKPVFLDEPDVKDLVTRCFDASVIETNDLETTIFNLILPSGTVRRLNDSASIGGLGGYHGSLHINRGGNRITLYYSANVFSEFDADGKENGIVAFDQPWKNVVGTLYHELNEFRTDPDVGDAIALNSNDPLGWTSRRGHEVGDQPIAANPLELVFKEVRATNGGRRLPVQFMFSNAVHGAEGPISSLHS